MKEGAVTGAVLVVCESGSSSRCMRKRGQFELHAQKRELL